MAPSDPLTIEAGAALSPVQGTDFDLAMVARGGHGEVTWSVTSGQLPPGLALTDAPQRTLHISGRPTRAGAFALAVEAIDERGERATRSVALTIDSSLTVTGDPLPEGVEDAPYHAQLSAAGGSGAGYRWRIRNGDLPAGLAISGQDTATLMLEGTPKPGRFAFTITVADSDGYERSREVMLWVRSALVIEGDPQPALVGESFDLPLHVRGGIGPYIWRVDTASIPGCELAADGAGARLHGVPSVPGATALVLTVTDQNEGRIEKTLNLDLRDRLHITTETLPSGQQGVAYTTQISGAGGLDSAYHWEVVAGRLPDGLTLAAQGAPAVELAGTPTSSGSFTFTVRLSTPRGSSVERSLDLKITNNPPQLAGKMLGAGVWGRDYADTVTGSSHVGGAVQWKVIDGWLPPGVALNATTSASVTVSGRPLLSGSFEFTLQMTDAGGVAQGKFRLDIAAVEVFQVVGRVLPRGRVGEPYSAVLRTRNAAGEVGWRTVDGELPPGVTLQSNGSSAQLVGAPTTAGFYRFVIEATADGKVSSRPFAIQVRPVTTWALVAHGGSSDGPYQVSVADVTSLPATTVVVKSDLRGWVNDLSVSPDGRYATFTSGDLDRKSLFLIDLRGGPHAAVLLTTSLRGDRGSPVTWSPDGAFAIVPVQIAGFEFDMYMLDVSGADFSFRSLGIARADWTRAWAPDGNQLAFVSPRGDVLYVARREGSSWSTRAIPTGTTAVWPLRWTPDASGVIFSASGDNQGLYFIDVTGADPLPIRLTRPRLFFNPNLISASDDNTRIILTDCCGAGDEDLSIWAFDASRQAFAQPVAMTGGLRGPIGASWSPDSQHLLLVNRRSSTWYIVDADAPPSAPPAPLPVSGLDGPWQTVSWTPDGRSLLATTDTAVYRIPVDAPAADRLLGGLFRWPRTWFLAAPSPFVFIEDGGLQAIDLSVPPEQRRVLRVDSIGSGNRFFRADPLRKRVYYGDLNVDHESLYIVDASGSAVGSPSELLRVTSQNNLRPPLLGNIGFSD